MKEKDKRWQLRKVIIMQANMAGQFYPPVTSTPVRLGRLRSHTRKRLGKSQSMRVTVTITIPGKFAIAERSFTVRSQVRHHRAPPSMPCIIRSLVREPVTVFRNRAHASFGLRHMPSNLNLFKVVVPQTKRSWTPHRSRAWRSFFSTVLG